MKKIRLALIATLAIMTFAIFGASQNQTVSAKVKHVTTFPKSMRGTWYAYTKPYGLAKFIIKTHSITGEYHFNNKNVKDSTYKLRKPFSKKYKNYLAVGDPGASGDEFYSGKHGKAYNAAILSYEAKYVKKDNRKWLYLIQTFLQGGLPHQGYLNVSKVNGQPILSYITWIPNKNKDPYVGPLHLTKSKQLAKKMKNKKLKGFKYHRNYNQSYVDLF